MEGRAVLPVKKYISFSDYSLVLGVLVIIVTGRNIFAAGALVDQNGQPCKRDSRNRQQQSQRKIVAGLRNRQPSSIFALATRWSFLRIGR